MNTTTAPLSQLQAFLTVARLSSFSAAARELRVSTLGRQPVGATARGAAARDAPRPHDAQRVAHRRRTAPASRARGRRWARRSTRSTQVSARRASRSGRLRLSVPRTAVPFVIDPMLPAFRERYPRVAARGHPRRALRRHRRRGLRRGRAAHRGDRARHGAGAAHRRISLRRRRRARATSRGTARPSGPRICSHHECITYRSQTTGALYAWELERGRKSWRVPVRGGVVTNDSQMGAAARGARASGLAYVARARGRGAAARTDACSACSTATRRRCPASSSTTRVARSARRSCARSSTPRRSWCRAP